VFFMCSFQILNLYERQRGDGFPLAAMLAVISKDNKELIPMMSAHIYTVCPTAIPSLPHTSPDASEEEFMKALGMLQINKNDEPIQFETFERFLNRTEGVISLVADIMASQPSSHLLLDGHNGAIQWLKRFLSLLPEAPHTPLPLVTAPVLDAFLRGAGHMLANHHADEFKPIMDTIVNDIVNRLDLNTIGMPSSIRLKKTIEGGFEGFLKNLPSRALPELYYGGSEGNEVGHGIGSSGGALSVSFSSSTNAFGGGNNSAPSGPFSSSTNAFGVAGDSAPSGPFSSSTNTFGGTSFLKPKGSNMISSPFDASSSTNEKVPGFSSGTTHSPFSIGSSQVPDSTNSMMATTESVTNPSPFGFNSSLAAGTGKPGSDSSPFGNPNPSPFSQVPQNTGPSSFGGGSTLGSASNTMNPSPFGGSVMATSPSPFGTSGGSMGAINSTSTKIPFGSSFGTASYSNPDAAPAFGTSTPAPSTFGSVTNQQTSFNSGTSTSPFISSGITSQSPFGSSIGGASGTTSTPFGSSNTSTMTTPFGGAFGSAMTTKPSPFGNPDAGSSSSPFSSFSGGVGQHNTSFQSQQQGKPPPCTFFAQGRCNKGANCRFSHDMPQTNNFSSPFGGPRR
jgi:GLE1-like protein/CCCH-type zinc finger